MERLKNIAGYEKEKQELLSLIEIFNDREKYEKKGAMLPKGIIFYGEPGNGKTLFVKTLAEACSLKCVSINLADSATDVNICRQIRRAFQKAEKNTSPTMIFFDELDKVLPNDYEHYCTDRAKSILAQLLVLIDGMDKSHKIVFVATCNDYESLPDSLVRPGRFDKKISLNAPDLPSRIAILSYYLERSSVKFELPIESVAKLTQGFSGAALMTLVNECLLRSDENCFVSEALIRNKIKEISEEDLVEECSDHTMMLNAIRNVGSFIVSRSYHNAPYLLTTEDNTVGSSSLNRLIFDTQVDEDEDYDDCQDYYEENGRDASETMTERTVFSRNDYLAAITSLLGGYAAEEVLLGKCYDNLELTVKLTDFLLLKMAKCGFFSLSLFFTEHSYSDFKYPDSYYEKLYEAFEKTKEDCYRKARLLIEKNQTLIEKLAAILVQKKTLEKAACENLLTELGGIRT